MLNNESCDLFNCWVYTWEYSAVQAYLGRPSAEGNRQRVGASLLHDGGNECFRQNVCTTG